MRGRSPKASAPELYALVAELAQRAQLPLPAIYLLATELRTTATINSANVDAVAAVLERTGGRGVDVALEVVGAAKPLATAIGCTRRGGQIGLVGNLAAEVPLPLQTVVTRELTLVGTLASAGEYPRAIELIASGRDARRTADHGDRTARRGASMVRATVCPRAGIVKSRVVSRVGVNCLQHE